MMSMPMISAVIPTYNYSHFVTSAVESALAQTYPHVEVIVVDDGSTDDTRQRLAPYLDRIRYIYQENGGLSAARNTGIRAATGEWIALLDSDDVWHPRKLELQMRFLQERHPDIGMLATDLFTDQRQNWPTVDESNIEVVRYKLEDVLGLAHFGPSSALIRKSYLEEVGLFDSRLRCVEDRDLWIRLASRYSLAKLPLPLLFYRVHAGSLSNKCAAMERAELAVLAKAFADIPALRGRWSLRRQTYSRAAYVSAQVFRSNGQKGNALKRMLASFSWWPLPLDLRPEGGFCVRPRVVANLLMQVMHLRSAEPNVPVTALATPPLIPAFTKAPTVTTA